MFTNLSKQCVIKAVLSRLGSERTQHSSRSDVSRHSPNMSRDEVSIHILRKVVIDGLLLGTFIVGLVLVHELWMPFQRGFFCGDESLMFPYKGDTVTVLMLRLVGIGLPAIAFVICEWALLRKEKSDQRVFGVRIPPWIRGMYCVAMSFAIGACFCELANEIAKNTIGRPRPHFFDLCKPSVNCSLPEWQGRYIQSDEYTCTGDQTHLFTNMRKSFLSGHSSWAAYTMIFLALYLQKRMTWQGTRLIRHAIQFAVLMLSWYCALSRVSDYKHHWSDVLAGYALGATIALLMWSYCTDLVQKKDHAPIPQFEVNLNSNQVAMT